jgi:hypothetical protein
MAKIADRAEMVIRLPRDLKTWIEQQAAQDASSQNSVLVRALQRARTEQQGERREVR